MIVSIDLGNSLVFLGPDEETGVALGAGLALVGKQLGDEDGITNRNLVAVCGGYTCHQVLVKTPNTHPCHCLETPGYSWDFKRTGLCYSFEFGKSHVAILNNEITGHCILAELLNISELCSSAGRTTPAPGQLSRVVAGSPATDLIVATSIF
ncbi:hypothetical protein RRG08_050944 [Elysia crispata]|uniref:Uncharacterized protein n=1 Tax=Elysia crispata TaxID=231223 RepID=A0AAE0YQR3_9GAST|nr:hypothetical protein RRG08_050944 [Elysia crispata]